MHEKNLLMINFLLRVPRLRTPSGHGGADYQFVIQAIDPPRGVNRCISKDWLEKNSNEFFDCAPSGAAAFIAIRLKMDIP